MISVRVLMDLEARLFTSSLNRGSGQAGGGEIENYNIIIVGQTNTQLKKYFTIRKMFCGLNWGTTQKKDAKSFLNWCDMIKKQRKNGLCYLLLVKK